MDEELIPVLRVADAAVAVRWYERLGFTKQWEFRFDPDCPAFVSITRGPARLYLSEHLGDARPDTLICLTVSDLDAVVTEFGPAQPTTVLSMTTDAADAIAAAPTTRTRSARVGAGSVVAAAAPTGTYRDSDAVAVFCGDVISYSFVAVG